MLKRLCHITRDTPRLCKLGTRQPFKSLFTAVRQNSPSLQNQSNKIKRRGIRVCIDNIFLLEIYLTIHLLIISKGVLHSAFCCC